jgi:hypothetical protein
VTGTAPLAGSPTSNVELHASDAHSLPQVPTTTHMAMVINHMEISITPMATTIMVVTVEATADTMEEATVLFHSEQVIGDAVLKVVHTTTSLRTLIAFDAELPDLVLLSLSISRSPPLWVLLLTLEWVILVRWPVLPVLLLLGQELKLLVLVLHLPNHLLRHMACPLQWALLVLASLTWVV